MRHCAPVYGNLLTPVKPGPDATLVIVAGGRGIRLGTVAKGLIRLGDSTIVEHLLGESPIPCAFINSNTAETYQGLGPPIVGDVVGGRGAPGGVVTALAMASSEWVLVLGCDMPNVTRAVMTQLLEARSPTCDVVCGERRGQLEPLLGVYRRSLVHQWAPRVFEGSAQNVPGLRALLREARTTLVEVGDDSVFESVNTAADLRRIRRR